ncbi:MAG: hypothetical protein ISN29_12070, partial [Gammaproteobacteria bacterium AqS3]|nr:hypothetical protein [Gammaproteobacteria bacterium AqS3]
LTFTTSDWQTAQTVTVSAAQDADFVDDEATIRLTASGGGYDSASRSVMVKVTDDDDASASLTLSTTSLNIAEDGEATFTVRLASEPSAAVKVTLKQPDDSDNDDVTFSPKSLDFTTSNWNMIQTVTVNAEDDEDAVVDTATINLTASGGGYGNATGSVSVRVTETDTAGFELSETDGMLDIEEGETATFTLRLTSEPSDEVTVTLVQPDDDTANADVTLFDTNGNLIDDQNTLTFTVDDWDDTQTVTVRAAEDGDIDDDTATISLTAAGGGYDSVEGSLTVNVDDDNAVELVLSPKDGMLDIAEGDSATFTVRLDSVPSADVTVTLARTGASSTDVTFDTDDETAGDQDQLTFTTGNWETTQTVTVSAADDADSEDDSATIRLTAEDGGYDNITADVTVDVIDDDGRFVMPATLSVAEGGSKDFTVALGARPTGNVTVMLAQTGTT